MGCMWSQVRRLCTAAGRGRVVMGAARGQGVAAPAQHDFGSSVCVALLGQGRGNSRAPQLSCPSQAEGCQQRRPRGSSPRRPAPWPLAAPAASPHSCQEPLPASHQKATFLNLKKSLLSLLTCYCHDTTDSRSKSVKSLPRVSGWPPSCLSSSRAPCLLLPPSLGHTHACAHTHTLPFPLTDTLRPSQLLEFARLAQSHLLQEVFLDSPLHALIELAGVLCPQSTPCRPLAPVSSSKCEFLMPGTVSDFSL